MSSECLFCKIVKREIPADIVHEDEHTLAFKDINPQAPVHLLVIPKKHVPTLIDLTPEDGPLMERIAQTINKLAGENQIREDGFRTVVNVGHRGGQTVYHLHVHLLGGRFMKWPPG